MEPVGSKSVDNRGRTLTRIEGYIEVGVNPITRRMRVSPIDCWLVEDSKEKKDERKGSGPSEVGQGQ